MTVHKASVEELTWATDKTSSSTKPAKHKCELEVRTLTVEQWIEELKEDRRKLQRRMG